jgi:hypothetical protein
MAPTEQENEVRLADVAAALNRDHWVFVVTEPFYGRILHWVEFPWPGDSIPVPAGHEGMELAPRPGGCWTAVAVWYEIADLLAALVEERIEERLAALQT